MKVLLLGATGLLGHNVVRRLSAEGCGVVALVRRAGRLGEEGCMCEVKEGRPTDYEVLRSAASGCDAVVNCAGNADMSHLRQSDYYEANVLLPKMIARLVAEGAVERVVHVSSVDTIGYGSADAPADESAPMRSPFAESLYARSKREGECVLLKAAADHPTAHIVVVNPGFMIGPCDVGPSSGRMLLYAYRRRVVAAPGGGKAFVDVRDVSQAVVAAIEKGKSGGRYIVANGDGCFSLKRLFELQAEVMGYRQHVLVMPDWLLLAAAKAGDLLREAGVRTQLSTTNVRQLLVSEHYDNSQGIKELGYAQSPIGQAIADFHQWRNENKTRYAKD